MIRKILMIAALVSASCAHAPWSGRSLHLDEVRDSVYKVEVVVTIDTSQMHAEETEAKTEKNLSFRRMWHENDIEILAADESTATLRWSGTGWVSGNSNGKSYVMTAGHVCESREVFHIEGMDWAAGKYVKYDLPIVKTEHRMVGRDGTKFSDSQVIRDEDLDENHNGIDLCMLGVAGDLGAALPIASEDPPYGSPSEVVGAPRGLWGGGVAVASDVKFSGRGSVFGTAPDGLAFNGNVAPGNSGSAVLYKGRVVGLISLGATQFPTLSHAVPHEMIRSFIRRAMRLASEE